MSTCYHDHFDEMCDMRGATLLLPVIVIFAVKDIQFYSLLDYLESPMKRLPAIHILLCIVLESLWFIVLYIVLL